MSGTVPTDEGPHLLTPLQQVQYLGALPKCLCIRCKGTCFAAHRTEREPPIKELAQEYGSPPSLLTWPQSKYASKFFSQSHLMMQDSSLHQSGATKSTCYMSISARSAASPAGNLERYLAYHLGLRTESVCF